MKKLIALFAIIIAGHASSALAVPKDAIDRAQAAFAEQLSLECSPTERLYWVAEDAVYQYVLSGINVRLRVEGRDAVAEHLCALSGVVSDAKLVENIRYFPTLDPKVVFVQYELVPADGIGERSNSLAIIEMRQHQIAKFTQLNRSAESLKVLQAATGGMN